MTKYDAVLEIARVLTVSTAHICKATAALLPDCIPGVIAYDKGEYGWLIYSPQVPASAPEDLQRLMTLAKNNKCQWLVLDRDGNTIDNLETYDW